MYRPVLYVNLILFSCFFFLCWNTSFLVSSLEWWGYQILQIYVMTHCGKSLFEFSVSTIQSSVLSIRRNGIFLNFPACFSIRIIFSNLNFDCSNLLDMRNLQEHDLSSLGEITSKKYFQVFFEIQECQICLQRFHHPCWK